MFRHILHSSAPILLVGAGPASAKLVTKAFSHAESIVAVDGGLTHITDAGLQADCVIGDFDSQTDTGDVPRLHRPDQNQTDFQKALAEVQAPVILGAGFIGGRLDHQLASMTALLGDDRPVILLSETELCFIAPAQLDMPVPDRSPVGFYPLKPCRADIEGVKYPSKDAAFAPDGLISTSNHMAGDQLTIRTMGRGLLVILPVSALAAAISALWPKP